jgi:sec-independent protein translocase protein TatB
MFDLGWSEMLIIGIVALIVVGPKELPGLFRSVGQWVGKARGVAREFSRAMEAAADETGMKDIDRTIRAAANPVKYGTNALRESALGKGSSTLPPVGAPLNPGAPIKPGGATETLAQAQADQGAALKQAAAERRIADAERRAAEAERRAMEAERRAAATPGPGGEGP